MKVSAIIPAYNEEKTIKKVIEVAKKAKNIDEILVIDDGSTDETYKKALLTGINVVRHPVNKGKGAAIRTGVNNSKGDVLLFLDADVNWTPRKLENLIEPILKGDADFVKSSFTRKRGRLTELTVKPIMKVIFPGLEFSQPLSGQFAGKREFLEKIKIEDKWGIDIGILLDAVKYKQRIKEVDIGKIVHKKRPLEELITTGEDIVKTIFKKAHEMEEFISFDSDKIVKGGIKGIVVFDLDKTLIKDSSIEHLSRRFRFMQHLARLRFDFIRGKMKEYQITIGLAKCLVGKTRSDIERVCAHIPLKKNAQLVIQQLKHRGYITVIISSAFSPVVEYFAKRLGVNEYYCPILLTNNNRYTGDVEFSDFFDEKCCSQSICKKKVFTKLLEKHKLSASQSAAVGNNFNDKCMIEAAGIGIALKGNRKIEKLANVVINDLSEILLYMD